MLSVNQMFYGTDEPVWGADRATPNSMKPDYLGSAHRTTAPPPPRRNRDPFYPNDDYEDPYHSSSRRRDASYSSPAPRSGRRSSHYNPPAGPAPVPTVPRSNANPRPAPVARPTETPINPRPAVLPTESPVTQTPVLPVAPPTVPANTPYTMLLKVPLCCEGCEQRVVKKLLKVRGVMSVTSDIEKQRVTVRGTADTDEVVTEARQAFKKSRLGLTG